MVNTTPENFVLLSDINNDGKADLILSGLGVITTLLGDGNGHFPVANDLFGLSGVATEIAVADLDQDGILDIAATAGNAVEFAFGSGDGSFVPAEVFLLPAPFSEGIALAAGDLNEDGRPDLLVLASGNSGTSMRSFLNEGSGFFGSPAIYPVQGIGTRRKPLAAVRSRFGDSRKSMVSPAESTARYK